MLPMNNILIGSMSVLLQYAGGALLIVVCYLIHLTSIERKMKNYIGKGEDFWWSRGVVNYNYKKKRQIISPIPGTFNTSAWKGVGI